MKRLAQPLVVVLLLLAALAPVARADVYVAARHMLILRQGLDQLYGSYVFAVQNTDPANKAHFRAKMMLPKEMDDFVPQEGLEAGDLALAPEGGVVVEKDFDPGVQIVSIGFKVPASYGRATMTLAPTTEIASLSVLVPKKSGLAVKAPFLRGGPDAAPSDAEYDTLMNSEILKAGAPLVIEVDGLPEGRKGLWIVVSVVAGLLVLLAGLLAWRTRPRMTEEQRVAVLV